ncbi:hypothetical protein J3F83DRAFT_733944, partial [Trichoderma novae-zelandiae]
MKPGGSKYMLRTCRAVTSLCLFCIMLPYMVVLSCRTGGHGRFLFVCLFVCLSIINVRDYCLNLLKEQCGRPELAIHLVNKIQDHSRHFGVTQGKDTAGFEEKKWWSV